ncbi:hypothetical protein [Streptacidiphilus sp. EB129]|uniref:hypothetical protein n=1 Tax=Streptacidiphilus sp. EB129 TaxID=3156262 RepID=UPI0035137A5E
MLLGIGDVVRITRSQTLGTVLGVAHHASGNLVSLRVAGTTPVTVTPGELELVARGLKPMTTTRAIATLLFGLIAVALAIGNVIYLNQHHINVWMLAFVAQATLTSIFAYLIGLFLRPRRVAV